LAVVLLLFAACAAQPPERDTLPDIADVLPEPEGCLLSVGEPRGVEVDDVVAGSSSDGVLQPGDVIVAIDGATTTDVAALVDVMAGHSPGDTIRISYRRDEAESAASITLGANPTDATKPQIGIMIRTDFARVAVDDIEGAVTPGLLTRPISIGGRMLVLDPEEIAWEPIDLEVTPEANWVATTHGIFSLSIDENPVITNHTTGLEVETDGFQGWSPGRLIGSIGPQLLLVVSTDIPDQPGFVNIAIALFSPDTGTTRWVSPNLPDFGIPVAAFGALDESAFVAVGADQETGAIMGVEFFDANGVVRDRGDLTELGTPIGWFDGTSMAFLPSEELVSVFSFVDGSIENYTLASGLIGALLASVGDGRHVLAVDGRDLLVNDITVSGSEVRTLADNCTITRIGETGWGL
jgi:hypothetical protein